MRLLGIWLGILLALGTGCRKRLTIYADPWLGGYAQEMAAAYAAVRPDIQVDLRILSSELVAWHIRYGQPVDVFLCFGPDVVDSMGIYDQVARRYILGQEQVVWVTQPPGPRVAEFGTAGCVVLDATHRPLRRYTEAWLADTAMALPECRVYSGFYRQTVDYLARGWVSEGLVPGVMVRRMPGRFAVRAAGPVDPNAYVAFQLKEGSNPEAGVDFFQFLQSEKSKELLAKAGIIR